MNRIPRFAYPSVPLQFLMVFLVGWVLALAVGSLRLPLVAGGMLALGILLVFLARPDLGVLFVLLARASTDSSFRYLAVYGGGGQLVGGLPNIGLILILTLAGGMYILSRGVTWIGLPGGRVFTLLILTGLLGVLRADDFMFSMNEWVPVVASFVIYALVGHLFYRTDQIQRVVDVIIGSFFLPAVFGLYQLATGQMGIRREFPGIYGTFLHPNSFGFYLVLIIAVLLAQASFHQGKRRVVAVLGLCVAVVLLVSTYARVAWAGALVVMLVVGGLRVRALLLLLPPTALAAFWFLPSVGERLADPLGIGGSLADRVFNLWPATLRSWLAATEAGEASLLVILNRLAGLGPGIGPALGRFGLGFVPHNDYLRVLVEYGIFGLVLYFGLLGALAAVAFRTWRMFREMNRVAASVALSFLAVTLAFPVMSITDNVFAQTVNQIYFWTLAGLTAALKSWGDPLPKDGILKVNSPDR